MGYEAWYGNHKALCLTLTNGNVSCISIALRTVINTLICMAKDYLNIKYIDVMHGRMDCLWLRI